MYSMVSQLIRRQRTRLVRYLFIILDAKLFLVPEITLTRIKYWLNEYPIVIEDLQVLPKCILSNMNLDKSSFDTGTFFDNQQTTLSLFFETGPEKENWFHKYRT
jgi:hypothetical protein